MLNKHFCPFCNIKMYEVVNNNYPSLETFLCYECGFNYNLTLFEQKSLFHQYQKLFIYSKEKGITTSIRHLVPKNNSPTEFQQRNKITDDETEPIIL
jgi:hypothetical protein